MPIGDLLASISGEPSPTLPPSSTFIPKRKATNELERPVEKSQRTNDAQRPGPKRPSDISTTRPPAVTSTMAKMKIDPKASVSSPTSFRNGQPTPPPTKDSPVSAKPPKKGSFAEIMARAKLAQESLGQVGKIQHKKIEKVPSRREREEVRNQKVERIQKNLGPNGKFRSALPSNNDRAGVSAKGKAKAEPPQEKKVKKAAVATTGYAGTARPKPGGAKPPSKPSSSYGHGSDRYRDERRPSSTRYTYVSEEEDEEEEDGYGSDMSSDMEAAAFEVDEEEEEAARIARREDAEALAEENRLKREKLEKKRRLAALAKSKR